MDDTRRNFLKAAVTAAATPGLAGAQSEGQPDGHIEGFF